MTGPFPPRVRAFLALTGQRLPVMRASLYAGTGVGYIGVIERVADLMARLEVELSTACAGTVMEGALV